MDRATWLSHFHAAPEPVQAYLLSPQSADHEDAGMQEQAFDHDIWDRIMDLVWEIIFGGMSRIDFEQRLKPLCGERKLEDVERSVLRRVVLPLADLVIWDVDGRLMELGVAQNEIQGSFRISLRPVSYGAAVRRIAAQAKLSILSEEMIRRVREAFMSYVKGVRTIEQFLEILQRRQDEGGIGLSSDQAHAYAQAMQEFLNTTEVMSEQDYADWLTNRERQEVADKAQTTIQTEAGVGLPIATPGVERARSKLDQAVQSALQAIGALGLDEALTKRLGYLISTRLRDVRNDIQTRQMLERDRRVGGLGLPPPEAERVAGVIEQTYRDQREQILQEEKGKIEQTLEAQKVKIEERKREESEAHAQWYQDKVQQLRPEEALRQAMAAPAAPPLPGQDMGLESKARNSLDGIRSTPRLMGLSEELGGMTLEAFRRLAKTPEQAIGKLQQKIETLRQESFEHWTEGVQAWRACPLQQTYLRLVADSFKAGVPVAELAEQRRTSDPNIPTSEELGAIIQLNAQLEL